MTTSVIPRKLHPGASITYRVTHLPQISALAPTLRAAPFVWHRRLLPTLSIDSRPLKRQCNSLSNASTIANAPSDRLKRRRVKSTTTPNVAGMKCNMLIRHDMRLFELHLIRFVGLSGGLSVGRSVGHLTALLFSAHFMYLLTEGTTPTLTPR